MSQIHEIYDDESRKLYYFTKKTSGGNFIFI